MTVRQASSQASRLGVARVTADEYIASVIAKYAVDAGPGSPAQRAAADLVPMVTNWANRSLLQTSLSGSYAKGTATSLGTDVDIFISLRDVPGRGMKEIYWGLFQFCADRGLKPQAQNVSIRVKSNGIQVDLVPGRKQPGNTTDHTLYRRKKDSWVQTNVLKHIKIVAGSARTDEIRAMKIWRERNHLDFPSFYLELMTIEALKGNRSDGLAERVGAVLRHIAERFMQARIVDPANTNNVISDDLDLDEKRAVMNAARVSLQRISGQRNWEQVLW
jgi:hypothetical protein